MAKSTHNVFRESEIWYKFGEIQLLASLALRRNDSGGGSQLRRLLTIKFIR